MTEVHSMVRLQHHFDLLLVLNVERDAPGAENIEKGEDEHYHNIAKIFCNVQNKSFNKTHHAHRATHIKTQGAIVGKFTINSNLPPHLAQGLFARPGTYDCAARYSSLAPKMAPDSAPGPRGFAFKVFGVEGEKLFDGNTQDTQDFTFNNYPVLELRDIPGTYKLADSFDRNFDDLSKFAEEAAARPDAEIATRPTKIPPQNPVAMPQWSQGAYRYGDYVAKYKLIPATPAQQALENDHIKETDPVNHICQIVNDFHSKNVVKYTFLVQLSENLEDQPVEDLGIEWDEDKYPFQEVGMLDFAPQQSWTAESRVFWDDRAMCNPWHGLVVHQPLGGAQRTRRVVYAESRKARLRMNGFKDFIEPASVKEVPSSLVSASA